MWCMIWKKTQNGVSEGKTPLWKKSWSMAKGLLEGTSSCCHVKCQWWRSKCLKERLVKVKNREEEKERRRVRTSAVYAAICCAYASAASAIVVLLMRAALICCAVQIMLAVCGCSICAFGYQYQVMRGVKQRKCMYEEESKQRKWLLSYMWVTNMTCSMLYRGIWCIICEMWYIIWYGEKCSSVCWKRETEKYVEKRRKLYMK